MRKVRARRAHRKHPAEMREERRLLALAEERLRRLRQGEARLIPLREVLEHGQKHP